MFYKNCFLIVVVIFLLISSALAQEPVTLKLNWKPGETYRYKCEISLHASAMGESAGCKMSFNVTMKVLTHPESASSNIRTSPANPNSSLIVVEMNHNDLQMDLSVSGQSLKIVIAKDRFIAYQNGYKMSSAQVSELKRDFKDLRDLINYPIQLFMTESGRVEKVTGLDQMDSEMQKELAMTFMDGMMLPERPLSIGEQWTDERNLDSFFPVQPGQSTNSLAGRKVAIVWTLKSIQNDANGRPIVTFVAPIKERFDGVPFGGTSEETTAETDMLYETVVDLLSGTVLKEKASGTLKFLANGLSIKRTINVQVNGLTELVGSTNLQARMNY
jgi:hypothetical protein